MSKVYKGTLHNKGLSWTVMWDDGQAGSRYPVLHKHLPVHPESIKLWITTSPDCILCDKDEVEFMITREYGAEGDIPATYAKLLEPPTRLPDPAVYAEMSKEQDQKKWLEIYEEALAAGYTTAFGIIRYLKEYYHSPIKK